MHPDYDRADALSKRVIGAAIEVHRKMGPGLIESIYEKCLMRAGTGVAGHARKKPISRSCRVQRVHI